MRYTILDKPEMVLFNQKLINKVVKDIKESTGDDFNVGDNLTLTVVGKDILNLELTSEERLVFKVETSLFSVKETLFSFFKIDLNYVTESIHEIINELEFTQSFLKGKEYLFKDVMIKPKDVFTLDGYCINITAKQLVCDVFTEILERGCMLSKQLDFKGYENRLEWFIKHFDNTGCIEELIKYILKSNDSEAIDLLYTKIDIFLSSILTTQRLAKELVIDKKSIHNQDDVLEEVMQYFSDLAKLQLSTEEISKLTLTKNEIDELELIEFLNLIPVRGNALTRSRGLVLYDKCDVKNRAEFMTGARMWVSSYNTISRLMRG